MVGNDYLRQEYVARINRVMDYVDAHVDADLSLAELADVAAFSRFHFHRVFHAMVGETLGQYIGRLRVEKAAGQLVTQPRRSITEIALGCGFADAAAFARAFKQTYGMSASAWRAGGYRGRGPAEESKNSQAPRNQRQESEPPRDYAEPDRRGDPSGANTGDSPRRLAMFDEKSVPVRVEETPEFHVAYVRHIGPYGGDSNLFADLFGRLMRWAGPRGLLNRPDVKLLTVYHDSPEITDEKNLRTSVCVSVPPTTPVEGEVGKMAIPAGKCAFALFEIDPQHYGDAWHYVVGQWLPRSGYQPDDRPCYELYLNEPAKHPEGKHRFEICLPVKPL